MGSGSTPALNLKPGSGRETLPWPPPSKVRDVVSDRKEFLDLWRGVVGELSVFPHVMFELYNEPNGDRKAEAEWLDFTREAVGALRRITENIIGVQGDYGCWVDLDFPPPANAGATLRWIEKHPLRGSNFLYERGLRRGGSFLSGPNEAGRVFLESLGRRP